VVRTTIDFGIDLGTSESKIAVLNGTATEVFKNNEGQEYTPSVIWIDSKGRLVVGRLAKEQLEYDSENAFSEFKLQMGTRKIYDFARSGRHMKPEELSAEVLKSLRGDVQQHTGDEIMAAAISVPAAFELPQCDATHKAAELAGLSSSPLVQEPVAAALAYGFQSTSDRVFWMVYDFGGGTFDVAVIQVRDGQIQVVHHNGDNHLGGKLIDWEIVEQLFVPALQKEYSLSDFNRGNTKWKAAFAKLKIHAEQAKIRLSRDTATDVIINPLCQDDRGMGVRFEYELKRSDIVLLIEPFVERSVNLCRKTLEEKRLSPDDIEKVILVGGPTLTPIFRDIIKDKLKIPLESSIDPFTVITRGTAIFAGTQPMPNDIAKQQRPVLAGQYTINLEYEHIGNNPEPLIGGKVIAPEGKSMAGFTIEFAKAKTNWRSGKISVTADGTFMTNVHASERTSEFLIELRDGAGNLCETVPDRFNYTLGMTITGQPLINSIGVGLANKQMQIFFSKGTPLPAKHREIDRTTVSVKKGESGALLRIPVYEGEVTRRADRNSPIGALEISGKDVRRDLPLGSEVEITINIDESRLVLTKAYIPVLDEEFERVLKLEKEPPTPEQLVEDFHREKERLEKVREQASQVGDTQANKSLQRIEAEGMVHDIEVSLAAARTDIDAVDRCDKRLRDLKISIDEVEDALERPTLVNEAEKQIEDTRKIVDEYGKTGDRNDFASLEREIKAAMAAKDDDLLRQKIDHMRSLGTRILMEQPGFWVGYFQFIEGKKSDMRDQALAERLIVQGHRAIDTNDFDGLRTVVLQLNELLAQPVAPDDSAISHIMPKFHS
jgi:molecular chaperone DnaK